MTRLSLYEHLELTTETEVVCGCGRTTSAKAVYDARAYAQIADDWCCWICFSAIDREEAAAREPPLASWSEDCEVGNHVRALRQARLTACDWTQMPDVPLSPALKTAWAAYRQALRDITETCSTPEDVTWPDAPETSEAAAAPEA